MPIVFSSGETLGRLRFGTLVGRFQDFVLYHAQDEVKRREVLVRQYAPEEPEKAMSGLPAAGRHAKSRWDQLLEIQLQRFDLARKSLPAASPYHVSLVDHLLDDTFYAILSHPAAPTLVADFAEIKSPSEPALHQLLLPIIEVLSSLHKNRVLYCGLGPDEILLDRTDPASLGVPVFAGFGSIYHWGGMGPPRPRPDDRPGWAPEFFDRQAPLTAAADVYALGALTYQLMTGTPPSPARARLKGSEHAAISELAPSYSSSLRRAVDQALALDPEARFPSIKAFRELALPAVAQSVRPAAPAARRAQPAAAPKPVRRAPQAGPAAARARAAGASISSFLSGLATSAVRLAPRLRAPARAQRPLPDIKPALDTARARVAEGLARLKASPKPRAEELRERPAPPPAPIAPAKPVVYEAPKPVEAKAAPAPVARPEPVKRVRKQAEAPVWFKTGLAAAGRQWQPMVAAVLVLAGGAWWLKSAEVWPLGPFERSASGSATSSASPNTAKNETRAADDAANASSAPSNGSAPALRARQSEPEETKPPATPEAKRSPLIADIQTELKRLGLYTGAIDGIDAAGVRSAIAAARSKFSLSIPAYPSKRLLGRLKGQLVEQPLVVPAPPAPPPATTSSAPPPPVVQPARPKNVATAQYPRGALGREIEGWVDVTFDIDPEGDVQNARVTGAESDRSEMYFSDPALKAIRATNFYPAVEDNKPVWARGATRRFVFTLQQNR